MAVDIGGTKLAAGLVGRTGTLQAERRVPTVATGDPERAVGRARCVWSTGLLEQAPAGPAAVCGVGCGGPMSPGGDEVSPLNIPAWRGFPLRRRLAELTGLPTFVDNDAKALALAEGWTGAAAGCRDYLAMVVSTGVGGGIVLDGRLLEGRLGNAGHIGHVVVEPDGRDGAPAGDAAASRPRRRARPSPRSPAVRRPTRRPRWWRGPARSSAGPWPRWSTCSTSPWPWWPARWPWASASPSSRRPARSSARGPVSTTPSGARLEPAGLGDEGPLVGAGAVGWRGLDRERPR